MRRRTTRKINSLRAELHHTQMVLKATESRLHRVMSMPSYQAGFHDGVTVGLRQLHLWLTESREKAYGIIRDLGNHKNADWREGHDFASAWIDEAIEKLWNELEDRTHAKMAAGDQENHETGGSSGVQAGEPHTSGATDQRMGG